MNTNYPGDKAFAAVEDIAQSLVNLRDELYGKGVPELEVFFKINSCLYAKYPLNYVACPSETLPRSTTGNAKSIHSTIGNANDPT